MTRSIALQLSALAFVLVAAWFAGARWGASTESTAAQPATTDPLGHAPWPEEARRVLLMGGRWLAERRQLATRLEAALADVPVEHAVRALAREEKGGTRASPHRRSRTRSARGDRTCSCSCSRTPPCAGASRAATRSSHRPARPRRT